MATLKIMQGDAYSIPIEITASNGTTLNDTTIEDVEITLGKFTKTLKSNEIVYNFSDSVFEFPLTQEETFQLKAYKYDLIVRVKVAENQVIGFKLKDYIEVETSTSKVVL